MAFEFHIWELGVLIAAAALVVLTVYFVKVLKKLAVTVDDINVLLKNNNETLDSIVKNANITVSNVADITEVAEKNIRRADAAVTSIVLSKPAKNTVSTLNRAIHYWKYAFAATAVLSQMFQERKRKKILKKAEK
jgi:uncharacterized protein YoxC